MYENPVGKRLCRSLAHSAPNMTIAIAGGRVNAFSARGVGQIVMGLDPWLHTRPYEKECHSERSEESRRKVLRHNGKDSLDSSFRSAPFRMPLT